MADSAVSLPGTDILMNTGRDNIIFGVTDIASITALATLRVGTGTTEGGNVPTLTALGTPLASANLTMLVAQSTSAKLAAVFKSTEAVGTWTEAGLFDSGGNMWQRVEFTTPIVKASGKVKTLYCTITLTTT